MMQSMGLSINPISNISAKRRTVSHLSNNGVRESPPPPSSEGSEQQRESLFQDLRGLNVGFQNWNPTSVLARGIAKPNGRCGMGGAWEWTSTVLEKHEGFKPGNLYPEYTGEPMNRTLTPGVKANRIGQRISLTENTTSFWVAVGPPIRGSQGGRACKLSFLSPVHLSFLLGLWG
jgi:hypothetical protein